MREVSIGLFLYVEIQFRSPNQLFVAAVRAQRNALRFFSLNALKLVASRNIAYATVQLLYILFT
jgi:hypothetical protein